MPKSICIFSAFYPPHMGGIEKYTENLALTLNELNCAVTVVTSKHSQSLATFEQSHFVNLVRLPSMLFINGRFPILTPSIQLRQIWKQLSSSHFDLIIVNARYYPLSLLGFHLAKKTKTPSILIDHSSSFLTLETNHLAKILRLYEKTLTRIISKSYNPDCYGVSQKSYYWLSTLGLKVRGILPNSISADKFVSSASCRNFKGEFHVPSTDLIITFAGRLVAEKGALKLLEAYKKLREATNVHLFIAGDGEQFSLLSGYADSHTHVLGRLNSADLSALLSQTDIFCFPSDYPEGLPTALLEAGSHACAIVMSNTGGAEDLIPSKDFGIVLKSTEPDEIANTLSFLIKNPEDLNTMGKKIQKRLKENFSWEATAKEILRII